MLSLFTPDQFFFIGCSMIIIAGLAMAIAWYTRDWFFPPEPGVDYHLVGVAQKPRR